MFSKTTARPRCCRRLGLAADNLMTAPSGARLPRRMGSSHFTYVTAVTKLRGDASLWVNYEPFKDNLRGNPIKILTLQEMLSDLHKKTRTRFQSVSEMIP
jgi:hypothetical protein